MGSEMLDTFVRDGFVHIPRVFDLSEILAIEEAAARVARRGDAPTEHLDDGFLSWRAVTAMDPCLAGLVCDGRLLTPMIQILGANIHLVGSQLIHLGSWGGPRRIRTPERNGWHTDIFGMRADLGHAAPLCAVKAAVWLTDARRLEEGPTRFAPGSHVEGFPAIGLTDSDPSGWRAPSASRGDVTLFENRVAHAGGINVSGRTRKTIMLQYGYRWLRQVAGPPADGAALAGADPVALQLLGSRDVTADGRYEPTAQAIAAWVSKQEFGIGPLVAAVETDRKKSARRQKTTGNSRHQR